MTKTQAIKAARESVALHQFGGDWQVSRYDAAMNVWIQGPTMDYWRARTEASADKLEFALRLMDRDEGEIYRTVADFRDNGGTWMDYV